MKAVMHNMETGFASSKLGMIFGFGGFITKVVFLAEEPVQTLLSVKNIFESSIVALICTLVGLGASAGVNWLQKKWLGRKNEKGNS